MFGLIVAGRLVQTDLQLVDDSHLLFNIPDADDVNHVVVFLTGQQPLPDGMGAAVYFSWPNASGVSWQFIGAVSNLKPSAIFKIANLKKDISSGVINPFGASAAGPSHTAQIGISLEPLASITQQTPDSTVQPSTAPNDLAQFSRKMAESLYNYATSFAVTQQQMTPKPEETFVPLSTLQTWYQQVERKLQYDPNFWKS